MACRPLPEEMPAEDMKFPTIVDLMVEALTDMQTAKGTQHGAALIIAKRQVNQILHKLGTGWVYLPKEVESTRHARTNRNRLILDMLWAGVPFGTILKTFNVSRSTLYRIQGKKG